MMNAISPIKGDPVDHSAKTRPLSAPVSSLDPRVNIDYLEDLKEETVKAKSAADFNLHLIEDMLNYQHELLGEDVLKE